MMYSFPSIIRLYLVIFVEDFVCMSMKNTGVVFVCFLNNGTLLFHSSGDWKSEIKVLTAF